MRFGSADRRPGASLPVAREAVVYLHVGRRGGSRLVDDDEVETCQLLLALAKRFPNNALDAIAPHGAPAMLS